MDYSSFSGAPRFLTRPKAFMVSVGKDVTLSCQIVGNPIPLVIWEKDKLPIQSGGRFKMVEDEDSGQYICRAKNTIGEAFTAVSIKVGEETTVMESAPYFIQKPSSIRVTLGDDVTFKCKVQGSPPLSVNWEKDGRHVRGWSDSNRFQIESLGESSALKIQCARLGDSGTYMCRAENPIGSASATATLVSIIYIIVCVRPYFDKAEATIMFSKCPPFSQHDPTTCLRTLIRAYLRGPSMLCLRHVYY
uniref:Ig-like domain-containing protein n=1 Tax=Chrysemys picta bellii TaxID=8478 RepID=A0A8C3FBA6_CHRPI